MIPTKVLSTGSDCQTYGDCGRTDDDVRVWSVKRMEFWLLTTLLAISVFPAITSSLWLDETGTWCIVRGNLREVWSLAPLWNSTPPFYFLLLWPLAQTFGFSEVLLRLPSAMFSAMTAAVLYQLAKRWLDAEGAALAVLFYFCLPTTQFFVIDARPYALGMLLLVCAWLSMMRWLETGRWTNAFACITCAAASTWTHYTLALGLLPLAFYCRRLGWRRAVAATAGTGLLLLPVVPYLAATLGRKEELAWLSPPGWPALVLAVLPPSSLLMVLTGSVVSVFSRRPRTEDFVPFQTRQSLAPVLLLAAAPPLLFFLLGSFGLLQLFTEKYMVCKDIGIALLAGWALRGLAGARVRRVTIISVAVLAIPLNALIFPRHGDEGWRESSEWVREELRAHPETQLVLVSCFIESLQPPVWRTPVGASFSRRPRLCIQFLATQSCCQCVPTRICGGA